MVQSQFYMIAGLGNPGREYSETRHNIGFSIVEELASRYNLKFNNSKFDAEFTKGNIENKQTILIKPQSYMNRSGYPVLQISSYFKIPFNNIIVIHDELDLDFGRIMIVKDRGHGGHNGIRSIVDALGTKNFTRIRAGVGRPKENTNSQNNAADYVLSRFSSNELDKAGSIIKNAADAAALILSKDIQTAMNFFNRF